MCRTETLLGGTGHRAKAKFSRSFSNQYFWFTAKENKVYVISLINPKSKVKIKSLNNSIDAIKSVSLLGNSVDLEWEQTNDALIVDLSNIEIDVNGYALEVSF